MYIYYYIYNVMYVFIICNITLTYNTCIYYKHMYYKYSHFLIFQHIAITKRQPFLLIFISKFQQPEDFLGKEPWLDTLADTSYMSLLNEYTVRRGK